MKRKKGYFVSYESAGSYSSRVQEVSDEEERPPTWERREGPRLGKKKREKKSLRRRGGTFRLV